MMMKRQSKKMKNKTYLAVQFAVLLLAETFAANSYATTTPVKLASDPRIEIVAYSPLAVVPIQGTVLTATQITFGRNEFIENIQCGDLGAWTASVDKAMPNMLFLKPTAYGSHTNLTVITNLHTYYFELASGEDKPTAAAKEAQAVYALHFIYPSLQPLVSVTFSQKAKPTQLGKGSNAASTTNITNTTVLSTIIPSPNDNLDYSFHGDKAIEPLQVFDDGTFTYMQLRPHQPVPAVFAVISPNGEEAVTNVRQAGDYLVIQQVAPQFTLRDGQGDVASVFNGAWLGNEHTAQRGWLS